MRPAPEQPLGPSPAPSRPLNEKGWTLIELMLVTALIAIITPAITYLFSKVSQGMAADEMHLQLQTLNEQTMLRIHERLVAGRHLFQADSSGLSYVSYVTLGMSANTKALYPILAGTQLATDQPATGTGSFSPSLAVSQDFGNSILVGNYDTPQTFGTNIYNAPATATYSAANNYVTYGAANGGGQATQVIDLYRFTYYYLTSDNPRTPHGVPTYGLVEWQSIQFADYNELANISDFTLEGNVITWLETPGNVSPTDKTYAVNFAWDPTATDPVTAFYMLSGGTANSVPPQALTEGYVTYLTRTTSGLLSNGFFYGVSPNSSLWSSVPATVPEYAAASSSFPGGFEVGMSGNAAGVEVMIRSLLVAKGAAPKVVWNDQTMVNNVRDVW